VSEQKGPLFFLQLIGGLAVIAVCVYGFTLITKRPGVPKEFASDTVVRIDGVEIRDRWQQNFALAWKEIGVPAEFSVRDNRGNVRTITAPVAPYYEKGNSFPLVFLVIGMVSMGLGMFAFVKRSSDVQARLFYWTTLAFGVCEVISGEDYCLHPGIWPTYIPGCLFLVCFAVFPALTVHFTLSFLSAGGKRSRHLRRWIYAPAVLAAAVQLTIFFIAYLRPSLPAYRFFVDRYPFFRAYVIAFLLFAVFVLIHAYRVSTEEKTRAQILWVALAIAFSITPFIFLYQLPTALGLVPPLSEEAATLLFPAAPAGFAVAILRYRLMDITVVVNRGLVYSLLTAFTFGVYLFVVEAARPLLTSLFPGGNFLFRAAGVFLAAATFQPAHRKIQDLVDKTFFRQRYDYRRVVTDFTDKIKNILDRNDLLGYFAGVVRRALPVDRLSVAIDCRPFGPADEPCRWTTGDPLDPDPVADAGGAVQTSRLWARPDSALAAEDVDFSRADRLSRSGLALLLFLPLSPAVGTGFAALGRKKSGERFSREDFGLLRTLSGELAVNLERLYLQEEVIVERASKDKLVELDRLKTEFISTVSHELRTPMSAIQGMAEILQAGQVRNRDQRERFLDLMVAETGRLSRFIHNILDFGRIEREAKTYRFAPADLRALVEEALAIFREPLAAQGFSVRVSLPETPVVKNVDADAVKQALINVIDNAMKYSADRREIAIEVRDGPPTEIRVRDSGIGIAPEDLEKIFERFYRADPAIRLSPQGAGLGLKIVRHIMDGHGGEIRVESEIDAGTTFRLIFKS
jgi:signal transduction histidine kinase